jgi:hypothetical protein
MKAIRITPLAGNRREVNVPSLRGRIIIQISTLRVKERVLPSVRKDIARDATRRILESVGQCVLSATNGIVPGMCVEEKEALIIMSFNRKYQEQSTHLQNRRKMSRSQRMRRLRMYFNTACMGSV